MRRQGRSFAACDAGNAGRNNNVNFATREVLVPNEILHRTARKSPNCGKRRERTARALSALVFAAGAYAVLSGF